MAFKKHWKRYGKCLAGCVGYAGTGVLAGVAVGSVVPGVGNIALGIFGGISGLLTGAASTCG